MIAIGFILAACVVLFLTSMYQKKLGVRFSNPPIHEEVYNSIDYKIIIFFKKTPDILYSKSGDLQRIFTLVLFMFFIYTLFLSVLPGNETILCFVSAADDCVGSNDGDGSPTECVTNAYGACNGGPKWAIGGEVDGSACCGDDITTNWVTTYDMYTSDSCNDITNEDCVGVNDNTADDACCLLDSDCVYSGTCYNHAASTDIDGDGVASEFCSNGAWFDCDSTQANCEATKCSSMNWVAGGESSQFGEYDTGSETECCEDDSGENYKTREVDEAVMELGYADSAADAVCCDTSSDCVDDGVCKTSGSSNRDADGDGDNDYCISGTWKDCINSGGCSGELICQLSKNNCIDADGQIIIRNLGTTGIENSNEEFTSTKNVMLTLDYSNDADSCRYINTDTESVPPYDNTNWTLPEPCVSNRIWSLSNGTGLKYIFYQINFSDRNSTFNDSITYNFSGVGLDNTLPTAPIIYHDNYTNNNTRITINWYNSSDPESLILGIPLEYEVTLFSDHVPYETILTTSTSFTFTGFELDHNTTIYANVSAINSAGQRINVTTKPTNPLLIDLEKPNISFNYGSFHNLSNVPVHTSINSLAEDTWAHATKSNFSWLGVDDVSERVVAYSYLLTKDNNAEPDQIPEGTIGNFENTKSKLFEGISPGFYYFKVRAKDIAGNWGPINSLNYSIDSSPSSKPEILTETYGDDSITYTWSESTDTESGDVILYLLNLTDGDEFFVANFTQTNINNRSHTFTELSTDGIYNVTVGAKNKAGIIRWSNQEEVQTDFDPPTIYATPNITVINPRAVIKAWTNELANCYYNDSTSGETVFTFTNTTFHEVMLDSESDGHYWYTINCYDSYDNKGTLDINFTINATITPKNISGPITISTYENLITTFQFNVKNSDNSLNLTGLLPTNFTFLLNGNEEEASFFDIGNNIYNVSFIAPDIGTFNIIIRINGDETIQSDPIPMTVNELYLTARYEDPSILNQNVIINKHIIFVNGATRIGLATDDLDMDIYSLNIKEDGNISISAIDLKHNLYIFHTRKSNSIIDRERKISNENFNNLINPSFGYPITDNYMVEFILRYEDYVIQSGIGDSLPKGKHNILVLRTNSGDSKIIKFANPNDLDRMVLTG
jgi:hypothetical protein